MEVAAEEEGGEAVMGARVGETEGVGEAEGAWVAGIAEA